MSQRPHNVPGVAACLHSALELAARGMGVDVTESASTARVGSGPDGAGGFGRAVELIGEVPGVPSDQGDELLAEAAQGLPVLRRHPGSIEVTLTLHQD